MEFQKLASYWEKIEKIPSRNEMTLVLSDLFKSLSHEEIDLVCYLSTGKLLPPYKSLEFNISEKTILDLAVWYTNVSKDLLIEDFQRLGDWGDLFEKYTLNKNSTISIVEVYKTLYAIAQISGTGSQKIKLEKLLQLIKQLDSLSAKYVIRVILKKLRLGFSSMTMIDALSWMLVGSKELRSEIEYSYNILADLGQVSKILKKDGRQGLDSLNIKVGVPIIPSAAERSSTVLEIYERIGNGYMEPKIDGFRLQVHLDRNQFDILADGSLFEKKQELVRFFSRNLEDMTPMFPDLLPEIQKLSCQSVILEGEAVLYDEEKKEFLPFQDTISRKRKHGIEDKAKEIPLTLFVFDLLYLNGESYLKFPALERRKKLESLIKNNSRIRLISQKSISCEKDIPKYFKEQKEKGLEGIMAKKLDATYQPGARGFHWIKYKRSENSGLSDTIDVIVMGYYYGKGKRTNFGIGALLVGVYNKNSDQFETIAKIGTGIKDIDFKQIKNDADKYKVKAVPVRYSIPKDLLPDVIISPEITAVVLADEITRSPQHTAGKNDNLNGYALRFPRLILWNRRDKKPEDVTTIKEIEKLYSAQA